MDVLVQRERVMKSAKHLKDSLPEIERVNATKVS